MLEHALAAARQIPDDRANARWTAQCLDALGEYHARDDLITAVQKVEQAGGLICFSDIVVHLLELYEEQARRQHGRAELLDIIRRDEHAVRRLERTQLRQDGVHANHANDVLTRLRALSPATWTNGG